MEWIYLLIAAAFETGWPVGLKMAAGGENNKIWWIIFAIVAMTLSGLFLYFAQKQIPVGTAYAVWTGIGASCTFLIGVLFFHDTLNLMRLLGVIFIITGVVFLKLSH